MDIGQVQLALLQTLETARRCGLTHLIDEPSSNRALPPELLQRIAELRAQPVGPVREVTAVPSPTAHPPRPQASANPNLEARVVAASGRMAEPVSSAPLSWELPVLSLSDRAARFADLARQAEQCRQCADIVSYRQQTVFGDGTLQPTLCFVGEAPGADEDRSGKPFVGRAGSLLTKIIQAMQLRREDVYILNALKCRPPQNRTPVDVEIESCRRFVQQQLEVLQPQFIVCLGAVAVRSILNLTQPIGRLRGRFHEYAGARVVVTYHPSYLLRNESAKKLVWEDMKMLMRELPKS